MKKVLVIGASGMVASRFVDLAKDTFEIIPSDERTLDITDKKAVDIFFENNNLDVVVNFAAFTNVDGAEAQKGDKDGLVWKLNVEGPKYLAEICARKNIFLVHISTDFVFPGNDKNPGPYSENSELPEASDGVGWYGWTKNRAEEEVGSSECKNAIIRYGYPFRAAEFGLKKDWARNLLGLYDEHKLYPLFTDQVQSVLFIDELTSPLVKIIEDKIDGIFHIVSKDTTTPYEIGSYLLGKYIGEPVKIQKSSMVEFLKVPGRTPRPRLGGLKVEKTEEKLGMKFKSWREMVGEFISQLKS
jgi:dTDP-4-dehydrorhamnose reductase